MQTFRIFFVIKYKQIDISPFVRQIMIIVQGKKTDSYSGKTLPICNENQIDKILSLKMIDVTMSRISWHGYQKTF